MCRAPDRNSTISPGVAMVDDTKRVRFSEVVRFSDNTCGCLQQSDDENVSCTSDRWAASSSPVNDHDSTEESSLSTCQTDSSDEYYLSKASIGEVSKGPLVVGGQTVLVHRKTERPKSFPRSSPNRNAGSKKEDTKKEMDFLQNWTIPKGKAKIAPRRKVSGLKILRLFSAQ